MGIGRINGCVCRPCSRFGFSQLQVMVQPRERANGKLRGCPRSNELVGLERDSNDRALAVRAIRVKARYEV